MGQGFPNINKFGYRTTMEGLSHFGFGVSIFEKLNKIINSLLKNSIPIPVIIK